MIGLALEGGGAKGSYQVGAYLALKKCHVKINAVTGTSIGAYNGALIASHEEKKLFKLWTDATMNELLGIDDEKITNVLNNKLKLDNIKWTFSELYTIIKNKGLDISNYRALVRNTVNEKKLRSSDIKYGLTTIKIDNLKPLEVYIQDIPKNKVHDYIVASACLPIFKPEKLIDDSYYLDGGFYNLCPSDMLEKMGCETIYTINIKGVGFRKKRNTKKSKVIEIKPNNNLGSIIFFDKKSNENNIKYGYYDTLKVFNKLDGYKYYFKKRSNFYYKRLNHDVNIKLVKAVKVLINATSDKELVIKALEYILKKEKSSDLYIYNPGKLINNIKLIKTDNLVYKYIKQLNLF